MATLTHVSSARITKKDFLPGDDMYEVILKAQKYWGIDFNTSKVYMYDADGRPQQFQSVSKFFGITDEWPAEDEFKIAGFKAVAKTKELTVIMAHPSRSDCLALTDYNGYAPAAYLILG